MPYTTLPQITARIGEPMLILLTDRDAVPTGRVDTAVVTAAQAEADALIDGYLATRYALPLATTPAIVAAIALAITVYKLHVTEPQENITRDYQDAMKQLAEIGRGNIVLTDVAGLESAAKAGSGVQTNDRERPFTPENLRGFV